MTEVCEYYLKHTLALLDFHEKPMLDLGTEAICGILTFRRTTLGKEKHIPKDVVELLVLRPPGRVAHFIP